MAFNLFKRKEKEIIDNNDKTNSKDIVSDFGNFVTNQMSSQMNEKNAISSFDNNYNENIVSNIDEEINLNNVSNNQVDNLNLFQNTEKKVVRNFNPYENDIPDDKIDTTKEEQIKEKTNGSYNNIIPGYNPIMDNLEKIPNNIQNSEDINIAMSNIFKKVDNESTDNQNNINSSTITNDTINNQPSNILNDVDPGYKRCPKCGQKIREDYQQCFVCGAMLN